MTEIPEYLLKRAREARVKHSPPQEQQQTPTSIDTPLEDLHELAGLIDITSADVCNLGAVAIRHELGKRLTGSSPADSIDPARWLRKSRHQSNTVVGNSVALSGFDGHREVVTNSGTLEVVEYVNKKWLVGNAYRDLGSESVVSLVGWVEGPAVIKNGLFGKKSEMPDLHKRHELPFMIGFISVAARTSTPLFMPLLKSIKASNGCHLVFPDGREIDDVTYNKPFILNRTMELLEAAPELTLTESIQKFSDIAAESGDDDLATKMDALSLLSNSGDADSIESRFLQIHLVLSKNESNIGVLARTEGINTTIAGGTHQLMYELHASKWEKAQNGFMRTSYTIYGTLDPQKYGAEESAKRRFPRYVIYVDEMLGVEALRYRTDAITTEPIDEQDSSDIRRLLKMMSEHQAKESANTSSHRGPYNPRTY